MFINLSEILNRYPSACAIIRGENNIKGQTKFYRLRNGVIIYTEVTGLPKSFNKCDGHFFAYHIHDGRSCDNPGKHLNPDMCAHPGHSGDMPPLLGADGYALSVCFTERFTINDIIGKTVIIHENADDLKTQPSGAPGEIIACGIIESCAI